MIGADPRDALQAFLIWGRKMSSYLKESGVPISLNPASLIFDHPQAYYRAIRAGEMDVLGFTPMQYLQAPASLPLQFGLIGTSGPTPFQQYVLVVRRDQGIGHLPDLRKTRLLMDLRGRETGHELWLEVLLLRRGLGLLENFFASVKRTPIPSQALLPLFFGKADVGLVSRRAFDTAVELNPQLGQKLSVLASSPPLPGYLLIAFWKGMPSELRTLAKDWPPGFHHDPVGKQLLTILKIDRLVPFEDKDLKNLRALRAEHQKLKRLP